MKPVKNYPVCDLTAHRKPTESETMELSLDEFIERDRFAVTNGMTILEAREGFAVASMTCEERHLNGMGVVQGGVYFTLADFAFAAACTIGGKPMVTLNSSIDYFKAVKEGTLTAIATEVSSSRRFAFYLIEIKNDKDELVAKMHCTGYAPSIPPAEKA